MKTPLESVKEVIQRSDLVQEVQHIWYLRPPLSLQRIFKRVTKFSEKHRPIENLYQGTIITPSISTAVKVHRTLKSINDKRIASRRYENEVRILLLLMNKKEIEWTAKKYYEWERSKTFVNNMGSHVRMWVGLRPLKILAERRGEPWRRFVPPLSVEGD